MKKKLFSLSVLVFILTFLVSGITIAAPKYSKDNPVPVKTAYTGKWDSTYKNQSFKADLTMKVTEVLTGEKAVKFAKDKGYSTKDLRDDKLEYIAFKYSLSYKNIQVKDAEHKNNVYANVYFLPDFSFLSGKYSVIGGTDAFDGDIRDSFNLEKWGNKATPKKKEYTGWYLGLGVKGEKVNILKADFKPYADYEDASRYVYFTLTK